MSVQYLLGTKKVLDEKKSVIKGAIDAFEDEEKVLDLKLAKLRYVHGSLRKHWSEKFSRHFLLCSARTKAYHREMEEMDLIADSYKHTLRSLGYRHNRKTSTWEPPVRQDSFDDRLPRNKKSSGDENDFESSFGGWKQAKLASNSAFPSTSRSIKVESARHRERKSYSRPAASSSDDDNDNIGQFRLNSRGSRPEVRNNEFRNEPINTEMKKPSHSDSDDDYLPSFIQKAPSRVDISKPVADFDNDRTVEISTKSKHANRGLTIAEAPPAVVAAREIRPIQVRSIAATPSPIFDQAPTVQPASSSVTFAKEAVLSRSNSESRIDSATSGVVLASIDPMKRSTTSVAQSSSGVISVDSLMTSKHDKELTERAENERAGSKPVSRSPSPKPVSSSASQPLANTYPTRQTTSSSATSESKIDNDSLMKSSSGIYQVSNSSMDMESFDDHSSFTDLPPLKSKELVARGPPPSQGMSKNELYLEDSEDFRDVYPPSPSPFKRNPHADESKTMFRDDSSHGRHTPVSVRGSGRNTPLSARKLDERVMDPYDDHPHTDRLSQGFRDRDDDEYSQSFMSETASPMRMIDTSRSTVLELNFDTNSSSKQASDSYGTGSGPPTRDTPSTRSSPSIMNFGATADSFSRRVSNGDDDAVLMGTAKLTQTGGYAFSDASSKSRLSAGTDNMEKDSLGGTFAMTDSSANNLSPPPDEGNSGTNPRSQSRDGSSFDFYLGRRTPSVSELSRIDSSNNQGLEMVMDSEMNDRFANNLSDDVHPPPGQLRWEKGRAPLDLIELSEAFEVHISGIKVYPGIFPPDMEVYIEIEFLDTKSPPSQAVRLENNDLPVSVSYSACKYTSFPVCLPSSSLLSV